MAQAHMTGSPPPARRASRSRAGKPSAKVAITLRLDATRVQQLQAIAEAENRTLTNYVETALLRDLALRDEAARIITIYAAPGTSEQIAPDDVVRGAEESDDAYAKRRDLLVELWSIPDST